MERSDAVRTQVRRAYERARIVAGLRAAWPVPILIGLAAVLHERISPLLFVAATALLAVVVIAAWRGGAWRRGAVAGLFAGVPPLIVPALVIAARGEVHCAGCRPSMGNVLACTVICFAIALACGIAVGLHAARDRSPGRFTAAALGVAALVGLLACGAIGLGGGAGMVLGLVAGGVPALALARRGA
jgi:hypothetical protein